MIETKVISALVLAVSIGGVGYLGYSKVKAIGYAEAEQKCIDNFKEYEKARDARLDDIIAKSDQLIKDNAANSASLRKNIASIIKGLDGKTLAIIKNGECIPSKEFLDSYVSINKQANQNMKGFKK